jgi:hypothetical protein
LLTLRDAVAAPALVEEVHHGLTTVVIVVTKRSHALVIPPRTT